MSSSKQQLESTICGVGSSIAENVAQKNDIEKALGVLCNDGVYAYYVFVKSLKTRKNKSQDYNPFLKNIEILMQFTHTELNGDNYQDYFRNLSRDINDLLFFKEILEQALTYARYHAKASDH